MNPIWQNFYQRRYSAITKRHSPQKAARTACLDHLNGAHEPPTHIWINAHTLHMTSAGPATARCEERRRWGRQRQPCVEEASRLILIVCANLRSQRLSFLVITAWQNREVIGDLSPRIMAYRDAVARSVNCRGRQMNNQEISHHATRRIAEYAKDVAFFVVAIAMNRLVPCCCCIHSAHGVVVVFTGSKQLPVW